VKGNSSLEWRGDRLCYCGCERARLEPDMRWPGMWRVRVPGRDLGNAGLSDMASRTRARDAARAIVLGILNTREVPALAPASGSFPAEALSSVPAS
jgi:hypothetical protein